MSRIVRWPLGAWAALAAFLVTTPAAASFDTCAERIRASVIKAGVKADVVDAAFHGITYDEKAVRFSRSQPEYRLAIWDYMAFLVDDARIEDGKKMMAAEEKNLRAIEKAYGVDRYVLAALWGVESDYGRIEG